MFDAPPRRGAEGRAAGSIRGGGRVTRIRARLEPVVESVEGCL
jgi:hypothetical protein